MLAILHFSCKKCACKKVTLKRSFSTTFCALKKTNICNDISYLAKHSQLLVSVWELTCQTCQNIFFLLKNQRFSTVVKIEENVWSKFHFFILFIQKWLIFQFEFPSTFEIFWYIITLKMTFHIFTLHIWYLNY